MSDPREHGVPSPTAEAEDAWWDAVYDPSEREATHRPSSGTVDDWFASALGAIGGDGTSGETLDVGGAGPGAPRPRMPLDDEELPPIPGIPPMPDVPPATVVPPPSPPGEPLPEPRLRAPRTEPLPNGPLPDEPVTDKPATEAPVTEVAAKPASGGGVDEEPRTAPEPYPGLDLDPDLLVWLTRAERREADGHQGEAPPPAVDARPEDPRVPADSVPEAEEAAAAGSPVAPPPHVPTPTLPDGAALRWGRSRPPAGTPLPEPDALPEADPDDLDGLVSDTVLELARHGSMTLRAASARGEEARALGVPRRDRLVVARFGDGAEGLLVTAVAAGPGAAEAVRLLAASVGRSRTGLLADLRQGAQEQLRFGLQRLTARAARGLGPDGAIHAVLAPLDPTNRLRAGFGTGPGAMLLLGDDAWYDAYAGRRLAVEPDGGDPAAQQPGRFRFRAVVPEPGDVLLLCTEGLATPLREEPAVAALLAEHWSHPHAPAGVDFLRQIQARASGHSGDRTAAAIWEE